MKKISSKIIVFLLVTLILWGGVGFLFKNNQINHLFGIEKVYAQSSPYTAGLIGTGSSLDSSTTHGTAQTSLGLDVLAGVAKIVGRVIADLDQLILIPLLGLLVRMAAYLVDLATKFTLDSKNISNVDEAIKTVWSMVRNIFNITFIFILLYTAIRTIIGSVNVKTKEMLANVVIAALLINFSLFFTKIVIDAGNILATVLYNSATNNGAISMSDALAKALGIGIFWSKSGITCKICAEYFMVTVIQGSVLFSAFLILIYIALLMTARSVILIFLMATSPVGFMGNVLPKIADYAKLWRETLYGQVMIAPIFLLFFYLIVKIGTGLSITDVTGQSGDYVAIFKYLLILILFFVAVKITKDLTKKIGAIIEKAGMVIAGAAIGYATGGASLLATKTLGKGAAAIASNPTLSKIANNKGVGGFITRQGLKAAEFTSKASFDIRRAPGINKAAGLVGEYSGLKIDMNSGLKTTEGGYAGTQEKARKAAEAAAKARANTEATKVDPWSLSQRKVNETMAAKATAANRDKAALDQAIADQDSYLSDNKNLMLAAEARFAAAATDAEKTSINREIQKIKNDEAIIKAKQEKLKADKAESDLATDTSRAAEFEESVRKRMATEQTKKRAEDRLVAVGGGSSTQDKQAASILRDYIAKIGKEKTDQQKTNDLLADLIKKSSTATTPH